jgi:hypothetical protein
MQQIDATKRYEIGILKKENLDSPDTGEYRYMPTVLTGEQLLSLGLHTWNDFFQSAPTNFHIGKLYHVFETQKNGERKCIAHGTITQLRSINGLNDNMKNFLVQKSDSMDGHSIKFLKEQILEKDSEIRRLNSKLDEMTKEIIKSKEDKVYAEQELRRNIGLNDAINQKEEELLKEVEKMQRQQAESSSKIMESLLSLGAQALQMWMTQKGNNEQPAQSPAMPSNNQVNKMREQLSNLSDGETIKIKNNNGDTEDWTVKTYQDKKILVAPDGRMKTI